VTRPNTLTAAFWLWVVNALIAVGLAILVSLAAGPTLATADDTTASIVVLIVGFTVGTAVVAVARVILAWPMLQGRAWARMLVTILAIVEVVATLAQFQTAGWLVWVNLIIAVFAVVFQYLPPSNAFLSRRAPDA
jgi:hypothetical protein